ALALVSLNTNVVIGGNVCGGTVTLTAAAPAGGVAVSLSSSNPAVVSVAAGVIIPEGAVSAPFLCHTNPVTASLDVQLSASLGGATKSAFLTIASSQTSQPTLISLTLGACQVVGGQDCS